MFSVQLFAQSAAQMAEQAFNTSNYEDAAQLYDMAASLASGPEKATLYDAAKKSRTCKSLSAKAANLYKSGDSAGALNAYSELLKLNPNDKTAAARKSSLTAVVAKNQAKAKAASERKKAYKKVLVDFNDASLEKFVSKYSDTEEADFLQKAKASLMQVQDNGPVLESLDFYKKASKIFLENSNKELGLEFLNMAASLADPQALYDLALTSEIGSPEYVTHMVMAAAGGHKTAVEAARKLVHNTEVATKYFNALSTYAAKKDVKSAIYLIENGYGFFLKYLPTASDLTERLFAMINKDDKYAELKSLGDDVLLYFALNPKKYAGETWASIFLEMAAANGNIDAMKEYLRLGNSNESYEFFIKYLEMPKNDSLYEYYTKYINFLDSQKMISSSDAWALYLGKWRISEIITKDEILELACYMVNSSYTFKEFNKYWKTASKNIYDERVVEKIQYRLTRNGTKYALKVLKKISKINTGPINQHDLKTFICNGSMENIHSATPLYAIESPIKEVAAKMKDDDIIHRIQDNGGVFSRGVRLVVGSKKDYEYGKITTKYIDSNKFVVTMTYPGSSTMTFNATLKNGVFKFNDSELRKARLIYFDLSIKPDAASFAFSGQFQTTAYVTSYIYK